MPSRQTPFVGSRANEAPKNAHVRGYSYTNGICVISELKKSKMPVLILKNI